MTPQDLQAVAYGRRTIDSTEAPQVARELLAARAIVAIVLRIQNEEAIKAGHPSGVIRFSHVLELPSGATLETALQDYDRAREGE